MNYIRTSFRFVCDLVITARYVNSIIAALDEVIDSLTQKPELRRVTLLRPDNWFRAHTIL